MDNDKLLAFEYCIDIMKSLEDLNHRFNIIGIDLYDSQISSPYCLPASKCFTDAFDTLWLFITNVLKYDIYALENDEMRLLIRDYLDNKVDREDVIEKFKPYLV